jgi:hypothetical protein
MKHTAGSLRITLLHLTILLACAAILIGCTERVLVRTAPPPLPFYEQPYCPGPGYLWVPGYWAYGSDGYYWVPGMWELAPDAGLLWTPGYWGWGDGVYVWHSGYWARHVGFYGGINYGYGYAGVGYEGGYWNNRVFYYNSAVTRVNVTVVNNTYSRPVLAKAAAPGPVSYNGGAGGINARPTQQELVAAHEPHIGPTANQKRLHKATAPKPPKKHNAQKRRAENQEKAGPRQ